MRLLDLSYELPEFNLALDELLLNEAEAGRSAETLRFWESPNYFAVAGVAQSVQEVIDQDACERDGVPIRRRCSAGGCVLQGPGCLNYTLILDQRERPELKSIQGSYQELLRTLSQALTKEGLTASLEGTSDLSISGKKFSGNAQRRKKNHILHHGTILYNFDIEKIAVYLREPNEQPDYRANRKHNEFVRNAEIDPSRLRTLIRTAFEIDDESGELSPEEKEKLEKLAQEKYSDKDWIFRR